MKIPYLFLVLLFVFSCIEPYDFVVKDSAKSLVIEAMITDKSFTDTKAYPSDGRYFSARVTYSGDVTNSKTEPVTSAEVRLDDDQGASWVFVQNEPGNYLLTDPDFKAIQGRKYRLTVINQGVTYESSWEQLPSVETPQMGNINFNETQKDVFVVEAKENVMRTIKGIEPVVELPPNNTGQSIYYRWDYEATWIYYAPLVARSSAYAKCWATNPYYFNDYEVHVDNVGGYSKPLFFIETVRNIKLFEDFSLLVRQYVLNSDNYFFWKEMKDRASGSSINETPPYNLKTNYTSNAAGVKVFGYFGVAQEQARRWYFNLKDLSYRVENTLKADCLVVYGPDGPAPECLDCREYSDGIATTAQPPWWRN